MTRWWRRSRASLAQAVQEQTPRPDLPFRATAPLREIAAAWKAGIAPVEQLVRRAAELVIEGEDPDLFLGLAVLPLDPPTDAVGPALLQCFERAGDAAALDGDAADLLGLRWVCRAALEGRMSTRDLCRIAHSLSAWEGSAEIQSLEAIDLEFGETDHPRPTPHADLESRALVAAHAFLQWSAGLVTSSGPGAPSLRRRSAHDAGMEP